MLVLRDFIKKNKMYIITLLAWACFVIILPYTADDWNWGTKIGADRFRNFFRGYSGRYLGNCIVLVLTRSAVLRVVVTSIGITSIPFFIEKITKVKINYMVSLVFILLMHSSIWQMTIAWTSGFANYVTSASFALIMYVYIFQIIEGKYEKNNKLLFGIGLFALGLANTLVMEHITIYNVVISIAIIVYIYKKEKKVFIQYILYALGCILGAIFMFSNSAFSTVASGKDGYRSISTNDGFMYRFKTNYFNMIYKFGFSYNTWINIAIALLLWVIYFRRKEMYNRTKKALLYLYTGYVMWSVISISGMDNPYTDKLVYLDGVFAFLGLVCLIALLLMVFWETSYRLHMIFLLGSNMFLIGPLCFVNPVSARCFFMNYVIWILIVAFIIKYAYENGCLGKRAFVVLKRVALIGTMGLAVFYMSVYSVIHVADVQRQESMQKQLKEGKKEIVVKNLPFKRYVFGSAADIMIFGHGVGFKDFYNIPHDVKLKQVEPK